MLKPEPSMSSVSPAPVIPTPEVSQPEPERDLCEATSVTLKTPTPGPWEKQNAPTLPVILPLPVLYLTPPPGSESAPGSSTPVENDVDDVDVCVMTCLTSASMVTSICEASSCLSVVPDTVSPLSLEASSGAWPDSSDSHPHRGLSPDTTSKPYAGL